MPLAAAEYPVFWLQCFANYSIERYRAKLASTWYIRPCVCISIQVHFSIFSLMAKGTGAGSWVYGNCLFQQLCHYLNYRQLWYLPTFFIWHNAHCLNGLLPDLVDSSTTSVVLFEWKNLSVCMRSGQLRRAFWALCDLHKCSMHFLTSK